MFFRIIKPHEFIKNIELLKFSLRLKPLVDTGLETGANGKPPSPTLPSKVEGEYNLLSLKEFNRFTRLIFMLLPTF